MDKLYLLGTDKKTYVLEPPLDGADGKSAYQIALDNGFEGTEAEWLESLKGSGGGGGGVSDAEALEQLIEMDMLPAVTGSSGAILADENSNIVLRY